MAALYPLLRPRSAESRPELLVYESFTPAGLPSCSALIALVELQRPDQRVLMPAQRNTTATQALPTLLFDDPALTVADLLRAGGLERIAEHRDHRRLHRLSAMHDVHFINMICTELQDKRFIVADNIAAWNAALDRLNSSPAPLESDEEASKATPRPHGYLHLHPARPEQAIACCLIEEQRVEPHLRSIGRTVRSLDGFDSERFLAQARLFFHIEHLPGHITVERIEYLLTHGNELGPAMVVLAHHDAYLMKARMDVVEVVFGSSLVSDTALVDLLLQRALHIDLESPSVAIADGSAADDAQLVFHLMPPRLTQIQDAALHGHPFPADSFRIDCCLPSEFRTLVA